jgi:hypothetical protein
MPSRHKKNEFVDSGGTARRKHATACSMSRVILFFLIEGLQLGNEVGSDCGSPLQSLVKDLLLRP